MYSTETVENQEKITDVTDEENITELMNENKNDGSTAVSPAIENKQALAEPKIEDENNVSTTAKTKSEAEEEKLITQKNMEVKNSVSDIAVTIANGNENKPAEQNNENKNEISSLVENTLSDENVLTESNLIDVGETNQKQTLETTTEKVSVL